LNPTGVYAPGLGYKALEKEGREYQQMWWWKIIMKLKCPTKNKILTWSSLQNKAPTWDVLQKRNLIGLGWSYQCHQVEETIVHLMMECTYTK
jgi:hypothetical protein